MKDVWEVLREAVNDLNHTLSVVSGDDEDEDYECDSNTYVKHHAIYRPPGEPKMLLTPHVQSNGPKRLSTLTTRNPADSSKNLINNGCLNKKNGKTLFKPTVSLVKSTEYTNLLRFIQNLYRFSKTDGETQVEYPTKTNQTIIKPETPSVAFRRTQSAVHATITVEAHTNLVNSEIVILKKQDVFINSAGLVFESQISKKSFNIRPFLLRNCSARTINTIVDSKEKIDCKVNKTMFGLAKKTIHTAVIAEENKSSSLHKSFDNLDLKDETCIQRSSISACTVDSSLLVPTTRLRLEYTLPMYIRCILNQMQGALIKEVQVSNKAQYVIVRNALFELSPKGTTSLLDFEKNYCESQNLAYTELINVRKENEDLEEQLDVCFSSIQQLQEENGDLRHQLKEAQKNMNVCDDLKQENMYLQVELDEIKKKTTSMNSQETYLKTLRNEVDLLKNEVDNSHLAVEKMNRLLEDINRDHDATVTNLKKLWMRACEDAEKFQAQVNTLQNNLANCHRHKNDYDNLKASQESLNKEIMNKDCTITELTESVKSLLDRVHSLVEKEFYMIDKRILVENLRSFLGFLRLQGVINILGRSRDFMCYVLCEMCGLTKNEIFLFFGINDSVGSLVKEARVKIGDKSTEKNLSPEEEMLQDIHKKNISRLGISDMNSIEKKKLEKDEKQYIDDVFYFTLFEISQLFNKQYEIILNCFERYINSVKLQYIRKVSPRNPYQKMVNMLPDDFTGVYSFLSNKYPSCVFHEKKKFTSCFSALLYYQYNLSDEQLEIFEKQCNENTLNFLCQNKTLKEAKDWDQKKLGIMTKLVRDKFIRHSDLREKLKETGTRRLIWLNKNDDYFGIVGEKGLNYLGQILMKTRTDIYNNKDLQAWIKTNISVETELLQRPDVTLLEYKPPNFTLIEEKHILDPNYPYWLIGKSATHHVRPLNPTISRNHAVLVIDDLGNLLIIDLKSKLGTYVNDQKIENPYVSYELLDGDALKFASSNRVYIVKIDKTRIMKYFQEKRDSLHTEITQMNNVLHNSTTSSKSQETKILVRNLNYTTTTTDISDFFSSCGEIQDIILPLSEKRNFKSDVVLNKGFCIIHFRDAKAASASFAKNGAFLNKRHIKIEYYVEKRSPGFDQQLTFNKKPFDKNQEETVRKESQFKRRNKMETNHFHDLNKSHKPNRVSYSSTQTPTLNNAQIRDNIASHNPLEPLSSRKRSKLGMRNSHYDQQSRRSSSERSLDSIHT